MFKKIVGWILLIVGLLIIGWGVWSSFNVFTAKKPAPEIFEIQISEETSTQKQAGGTVEEKMEQQMQQVIQEQLGKILPGDSIPKFLNLISWSIFMGILIIAGGKLSAIGVRLLK